MNADAIRNLLITLASRDAATPTTRAWHRQIWRRLCPHLTLAPSDRAAGRTGAMSERELAQRLANRDAAAFDALVELYAGKLLGYAQRSLSPSDAEDVVQEAFIVVVKKAPELADHPNLGGFLFQTVRYLIIDWWRRRDPLRLSSDDIEAQLLDDAAADLATALIQQENVARLAQALHDVCNPLEQDVIALSLDGHEPRDIAQQLDLTVNHVRVTKHRAIQKLRAALEVDYDCD